MWRIIDTILHGIHNVFSSIGRSIDQILEGIIEKQELRRERKRITHIPTHNNLLQQTPKDIITRTGIKNHLSHMNKRTRATQHRINNVYNKAQRIGFHKIFLYGVISLISLFILFMSILIIWIALLKTPTFDAFTERKIASSTKIYDSTGEIVLFDIHENIERTVTEIENVSPYIKQAIIAVEDEDFYNHKGIDISGTVRAIWKTGLDIIGIKKNTTQGGSTITQQVIKNTLLTSERRVSRKMKEWFLALKLEKVLTKDEILEHYLNEAPFGGQLYGIETATQAFFGKTAADVTIAEAAYLAAIPNAPTLYSPYKEDTTRLEARKSLVLNKMLANGFITQEEYNDAVNEQVVFRPREELHAKAIHFVEYIREYLEENYGTDVVENDGLRVITTLNYDLQKKAEEIVLEEALKNEEAWNASNMGLVAIDPQTGAIITMVGSRSYSDDEIDGKFNVTTAYRQPGSSFKPFVYAAALAKGYTDQTILFDTPTQFTTHCSVSSQISNGDCYAPKNYDNSYRGPLTIRQALAESRNIPAVKMLYLVGINDAIKMARDMGIKSLKDANYYGLTLVLGGGEVRPLDMASAYGVFGADGVRYEPFAILEIKDKHGNILEKAEPRGERIIEANVARTISSILSDNNARSPLLGTNSFMNFGDQYDVAAKTGTTNDNRDAWVIGYSPSVATAVWSGNNDNTPMKKGSSISGSAWRRYMAEALKEYPNRRFTNPEPLPQGLKPIMRGVWYNGSGSLINNTSDTIINNIHSILYFIDRRNPRGLSPLNPEQDNQYRHWEYGVQTWAREHINQLISELDAPEIPEVTVAYPRVNEIYDSGSPLNIITGVRARNTIDRVEIYINNGLVGTLYESPYIIDFIPAELGIESGDAEIKIIAVDVVEQIGEAIISIKLE